METIAQIILNSKEEYISYDFVGRKMRKLRDRQLLNKEVCKENLFDVRRIFDRYGIKFWFLYGTLLGAIRDNDFIEYDTDTDIGIFEKDREKLILALKDLIRMGFKLIRTLPDDLVTIMRNDEYIDFGLFRQGVDSRDDKYWFYQINRIYGDKLEPLKPLNFLGKSFLIPNKTSELLEGWYSSNWDKPTKNYPARHPELIK